MRICDLNATPVNPAGNAAAEKHVERATPSGQEDSVELSRLSEAVAAGGATEARLEELRAQVKEGTYRVPAEELSKSIVRFHQE